jgi:uncharacterized membrane protein
MTFDAAHLHLMLNHLPVIGAPLLLILLGIGLLRRSSELIRVSFALIVALALASALVYITGEPAEELVEHAPWFQHALLERHEDHAAIALGASLVSGVAAIAGLVFQRRPGAERWLAQATWVILLIATLLFGWTGWSGGQIRHDELRAATAMR